MPTKYTAAIADGIDFKTYAMNCARAFGACISLRDESAGVEIPEFQPTDYHVKWLAKGRERLAKLRAMTPEEVERAALRDYLDECKRRAKRVRKNNALRAKYEAMLEQVNAYQAPTPEHAEFKKFMASQIEETIRFDCGRLFDDELKQLSGADWLAAQLADAEREIAYHEQQHAEEVQRVARRNAWVKALRESLV